MKKILFLTYDFPYPTNTGGKNRAYNLLKYSSSDLQVSLFSFVRDSFNSKYIPAVERLGIKAIKTFKRKKAKNFKSYIFTLNPFHSVFHHLYLDRNVTQEIIEFVKEEQVDIVHFESFYTSFYISNLLRKYGTRQIFGTENIEHLLYKDYARFMAPMMLKPLYNFQARTIEKEEIAMAKSSDMTVAVTQEEAEYFRKVSGKTTHVIPNGVDTSFFQFKPKLSGNIKKILFVGNFTYFPNVDAITFFYKDVFPALSSRNIRLTIVGKNSSKLANMDHPNVVKIEFLEDIREAYYKADVVVFPVRIGGGTNFKVLEAFAAGVPVVAFPDRVKGLGAEDNKHVLIARDAESFKAQIDKIFESDALAIKLAKNGRDLVEKNFSWESIGKKMNKVWKEL